MWGKKRGAVVLVTAALFCTERVHFGSVRALHLVGMCCGCSICMGRQCVCVCVCVWRKKLGVNRVGSYET